MQASFTVNFVAVLVEVIVTRNLLGRLVVHVGMQCLLSAHSERKRTNRSSLLGCIKRRTPRAWSVTLEREWVGARFLAFNTY